MKLVGYMYEAGKRRLRCETNYAQSMFYFKKFGIHFLIHEDIEVFHGIEWHSQIPADMRGILGMWEKWKATNSLRNF